MAGIKSLAQDLVSQFSSEPTAEEIEAQNNFNRYLEAKQAYRELQHENLPLELAQFDPYTLPEKFRLNLDAGPVSPYEYTNLNAKIYRHANDPKNATASGLETMPLRETLAPRADPKHPPLMSLSGAYALPRAMASAESLGVPQLSPEMLGGLYLQEGRSDMGHNDYDYNNPQLADLVRTLTDKYGVDYKTASFLATIKEKQDNATRLNKSFAELWNGTGKVKGMNRTGKTYAHELQGQIAAAQQPENKELMDTIRLGLAHGKQFPLVDQRALEAFYRDQPKGADSEGIAALMGGFE